MLVPFIEFKSGFREGAPYSGPGPLLFRPCVGNGRGSYPLYLTPLKAPEEQIHQRRPWVLSRES